MIVKMQTLATNATPYAQPIINYRHITNSFYRVTCLQPQGIKYFQSLKSTTFLLRTVALVLLKSKSSNPVAPEDIKLTSSIPSPAEDDVAFIAKKFNVSEFQGDSIEVTLGEYKENGRKKREAIEVPALTPDATYRFSQLNTDESGVRNKRSSFYQYLTRRLLYTSYTLNFFKRSFSNFSL